MSVYINGHDDPPVIMISGDHIILSFDAGSKCNGPNQEFDGLTAFLRFSLDDEGCSCTAVLAGRNAEGMWLETEEVPCRGDQMLDPDKFGVMTGDVTVPKKVIINLAFSKSHEIDLTELRRVVLGTFHDNLEKCDLTASCMWGERDLELHVTMFRFGIEKMKFDFAIPYESAIVVLQDKRRKTA